MTESSGYRRISFPELSDAATPDSVANVAIKIYQRLATLLDRLSPGTSPEILYASSEGHWVRARVGIYCRSAICRTPDGVK